MSTEERREKLAQKIEKLRALAASTSAHEADTASKLAEKLEGELRLLPSPAPPKRRTGAAEKPPSKPRSKSGRRKARGEDGPLVCLLDGEVAVEGEILTPFSHRYFQLADFAARWSGVILHLGRRYFAPYAKFYGPRASIARAWSRFAALRRAFDRKLGAWIAGQDDTPTSTDCDGYARGFLAGLEERELSLESLEDRNERRRQLARVDAAYRRHEGHL